MDVNPWHLLIMSINLKKNANSTSSALIKLTSKHFYLEDDELLCSVTRGGHNFLHYAAKWSTEKQMEKIIQLLPRQTALSLSRKRDKPTQLFWENSLYCSEKDLSNQVDGGDHCCTHRKLKYLTFCLHNNSLPASIADEISAETCLHEQIKNPSAGQMLSQITSALEDGLSDVRVVVVPGGCSAAAFEDQGAALKDSKPRTASSQVNAGELNAGPTISGYITGAVSFIKKIESAVKRENALITQHAEYNEPLLHVAARHGSSKAMQDLLEVVHVPVERMIRLLGKVNKLGEAPLHCSMANDDEGVSLNIVQFLTTAHGAHMKEVRKILLSQDKRGCTFLNSPALFGSSQLLEYLLADLPISIMTELLSAKNHKGVSPLDRANEKELILIFSSLLFRQYNGLEMEQLQLKMDDKVHTFMLSAASQAFSFNLKVQVISPPSRGTRQKPQRGRTAREVTGFGLKRDWLDQAGSFSVDFYQLLTPPKVLIFYSTKDRLSPDFDGEMTDAETEKNCVEEYFAQRNMPFTTRRDPTAVEIRYAISAARADKTISGLIVFVMGHGAKGLLAVEGLPEFITIQEIITHMSHRHSDIPKMLVLQACQVKKFEIGTTEYASSPGRGFSRTRADPIPLPSARLQAIREGVTLKHPDFLLYTATVSDAQALRHLMIPCLIESLRMLGPADDALVACASANQRVASELKRLDPDLVTGQLPKIESTLRKKFCLGKEFPPFE